MIDRVDLLKEAVCKHYQVSMSDLHDKRRHREVSDAKRMLYFFCRKHFKKTYQQIGKMTGCHHATVMHHKRRMDELLSFDKEEMRRYILVRDMVFGEETYIDAQDEYDCLIREKKLVEERMNEIELELKSLNKFKYGN